MFDLRIRVRIDLHRVGKLLLALIWFYLHH